MTGEYTSPTRKQRILRVVAFLFATLFSVPIVWLFCLILYRPAPSHGTEFFKDYERKDYGFKNIALDGQEFSAFAIYVANLKIAKLVQQLSSQLEKAGFRQFYTMPKKPSEKHPIVGMMWRNSKGNFILIETGVYDSKWRFWTRAGDRDTRPNANMTSIFVLEHLDSTFLIESKDFWQRCIEFPYMDSIK
jgi:hypothetical protein